MSSTRSRNTPGDYELEQRINRLHVDYETYQGHVENMKTVLPGIGLKPVRFPMQLYENNWDIESELFGIGSTNLVKPKTTTLLPPTPREMQTLNLFDKTKVILPDPLKISSKERFTMKS